MTATSERTAVEFTENTATYRPGNGNVIHYRKVNGIYYHVLTPDAVVQPLEAARRNGQRISIYLGDTQTGRDWLELHDVEGYIGHSMGPLRVPLLLHNRRSTGGGAILDHCLIKIKVSTGGILYQHAHYHTGTLTVREIGPDETCHGDNLRDRNYTHGVYVDDQMRASFRSLKAAEQYVRRWTG